VKGCNSGGVSPTSEFENPDSAAMDGCFVWATHHTNFGNYYSLHTAANSAFTSASITVTLKCDAGDKIGVNVEYSRCGEHGNCDVALLNGNIKLYLNGVEQTGDRSAYKHDATQGPAGWWTETDHYGKTATTFLAQGAAAWTTSQDNNIIEVVFERTNAGSEAAADVRIQVNDVRPEFSECEDKKVCLGELGLGASWNTEQARNLRASINLQWICLQDQQMPAHHGTVCNLWKSCLTSSGLKAQIIEILQASGAASAPSLPQIGLLQAHSPPCRNPFLTDPESWECACHEKLMEICSGHTGTAFTNCYRNELCGSPLVCESWKCAMVNGAQMCPNHQCPGEQASLLESAADDLVSLIADSARSKTKVGWDCF